MKKDLNDMKEELLTVWSTYHTQGTHPWTRETALQDLSYQIGSLNKLHLQFIDFRYNEGLSKEEIMSKMGDELADIISEVLFIADGFDIDMQKAWDDMLDSDRKKIIARGGTLGE